MSDILTFNNGSLVAWEDPQTLANLNDAATESTRDCSARTLAFEYI